MAFCLVVSVLGPVGGPAAGAQGQTSWFVNDDPSLFGPSRYWWAGDAGKGYGSNNYVYTYGIAGESSADNWARWSMGERVGRQEIRVYVPNTRATATVLYRINIGNSRYTKRVAQRNAYGWTELGAYDVDGASVTITLRDNDASQHWSRDGYGSSSIGVDAMAMRCVARCSTTRPTPVPTAAPAAQKEEPSAPRGVGASADSGSVSVSWSAPSDDGGAAVTGYRVDLYRGSSRVDRKSVSGSARSASFAGLSADTAYEVRVWARNSVGYGDRATASARTDAVRVVRSVSISLGADRAGCQHSSLPCRWVSATYSGFSAGTYGVQCYWSSSSASLGTRSASFNTSRVGGTNAELCWFNVQPGRYLTAVVDGVRSNTIVFAGTVQTTRPSAPRGVGISAGADSVSVAWSPPSDDGGAAVTGYRVDLYRGSSRVDRKNVSASARSVTFGGLSADTAYEVRVSAQNSVGRGPAATANARTDTLRAEARRQESEPAIPSEPRSLSASAGADSVSVAWSPPSDDGGAAVTGYRVDLYRGPSRVDRKDVSASAREVTFGGLAADTAYQFRISARNSAGTSAAAVGNTRTAPAQATVPSEPRSVRASVDGSSVSVSWSAPSDDGGAAVTGYRVDLYRGSSRVGRRDVSGSTTSVSFSGLDAGTAYEVRVRAQNSEGRSSAATASARTSRAAVRPPGAPGVVGAVVDVDSIGVVWSPPSSDGGSPVTGYRADLYRGSTRVDRKDVSASAREVTFGGLAADTAYQFRISARNSAGTSAAAVGNTRTIPPTKNKPSAPRGVGISAGADSVSVAWSPPSDDGGAAVTGYRVDLYRGSSRVDRKNVSASARSVTFGGLSADTAYEVRVSAQNSVGRGPAATANARTDTLRAEARRQESEPAIPSEPRSVRVVAGENRVAVSWAPPASNGGNPLTGYQIELYRGSTPADSKSTAASTRQTTFTNLDPDTAYTVLVSAKNSQGLSSPTAADFKTDAARDTRAVTIALGAYRSECDYQAKPCRWLSASYSGFAPGSYLVQCYWSVSPNSLGTRFASFNTSKSSGTDATLCYFNGTPGRQLTAVVDGVRSNTIEFPSPAPQPPQDLRAVGDGETMRIEVTWSPPSDSGSSAIAHYEVTYWAGVPYKDFGPVRVVGTSYPIEALEYGLSYTITVAAVNRDGYLSDPVKVEAMVDPPAAAPRPRSVCSPVETGGIPKTDDSTVESKDICLNFSIMSGGSWSKEEGLCLLGWCGECRLGWCNTNWYISEARDDIAAAHMGDLQGVFRLEWRNPPEVSGLAGRVNYKIYEKRTGSNIWKLVENLTPRAQADQTADGWWGYPNMRLELDGEVMIEISHSTDYPGTIAIRDIRLEYVDILPEHQAFALNYCVAWNLGVDENIRDFLEERSLKSWILGDEVETDFSDAAIEFSQVDLDERPSESLKAGLYELLGAAVVRLIQEIYVDGADKRKVEILEACQKRGTSWVWTGLGWSRYSGWGRAAEAIADIVSLGLKRCVEVEAKGIYVGCFGIPRRSVDDHSEGRVHQ